MGKGRSGYSHCSSDKKGFCTFLSKGCLTHEMHPEGSKKEVWGLGEYSGTETSLFQMQGRERHGIIGKKGENFIMFK